MARAVYDLKGYTIVLDKVVHVTRLFDADEEGVQFNVRLMGDVRLPMKFPDRGEGTMARQLLIEAIKQS
ncbi:MAG: hypothetical protein DHS20C11_28370 [Lysobacteraceae bacterium]|nr:MAG: hypothetical protein DHS20C11_28370 [Xanthomonadaceae bacterium]